MGNFRGPGGSFGPALALAWEYRRKARAPKKATMVPHSTSKLAMARRRIWRQSESMCTDCLLTKNKKSLVYCLTLGLPPRLVGYKSTESRGRCDRGTSTARRRTPVLRTDGVLRRCTRQRSGRVSHHACRENFAWQSRWPCLAHICNLGGKLNDYMHRLMRLPEHHAASEGKSSGPYGNSA